MKDFAKSIRVANAKDKNGKDVNVGDLVKVKTDDPSLSLGKVKSVSGETIKVDMTGDDDIWTTPARLVEKVGNKKVGNEAVVLKDGDVWVVLYANETKSKEFESEAEARKFAASVGNKKVGNSLDYNISTLRSMVTRAIGYNELGALQDAEAVLTDARYEREEKKKEAKRELENCENELREIEKLYSQVDSAYKKLK